MAARRKKIRDTTRRKDRKLIPGIMRILARGAPTQFVFEGPCRHGLRARFCLDGEKWARSDVRAASIVAEALRKLGARRPSWQEGQRYFTQEGYVPVQVRHWCAHCGEPIADGRVKFCSPRCADKYRNWRMYHFGASQPREDYLDMMEARRLDARQHRGVPCLNCGKVFVPTEWRNDASRGSHRYCSHECLEMARELPRQCEVCGTIFRPKRRTDAFLCSDSCNARAYQLRKQAQRPERVCATCKGAFHPATPTSRYCSPRCVYDRNRGNGHMNGKTAEMPAAEEKEAPQMTPGVPITPPPLPRHG
jgi:hypothetical protein